MYLFCQDWQQDTIRDASRNTFFILHRREGDGIQNGRSVAAKDLIAAASSHSADLHEEDVLIFDDDEWKKDTKLWQSVQKAKCEDVILDQSLKDGLARDVEASSTTEMIISNSTYHGNGASYSTACLETARPYPSRP